MVSYANKNILSIGTQTNVDLGFLVTKFTKNLVPDITENTQSIPAKIGVGYMENSYGALEITVSCVIVADDASDMYSTFRDISDALWSDRGNEAEIPISWSSDDSDGMIIYYGHVTSVSTPTWTNELDYHGATFTITFKCSSPYGYGETQTIKPRADYHGTMCNTVDMSSDMLAVVNSDNLLYDTYVVSSNDQMTQMDFISDNYEPNTVVNSWNADVDTIKGYSIGDKLMISYKAKVKGYSPTVVISESSRSREGEDVSGTAETYTGSVNGLISLAIGITYEDGSTGMILATKSASELKAGDWTTVTGTFTIDKPIREMTSANLYINCFAERITIKEPMLQHLNPQTTAYLHFSYTKLTDTKFTINYTNYSDGSLTEMAVVQPDDSNQNQYGEYTGTVDTTVPLSIGKAGGGYVSLGHDSNSEIKIKGLTFTVRNPDGTSTSLLDPNIDRPDLIVYDFAGSNATAITVDVDGTGVTYPLVSMKARDKHTKVGYEIQSSGNEWAYVGTDVSSTTGEVGVGGKLHYENVLHDECNNRATWKGIGKSNITWSLDGTPAGNLAVSQNGQGLNVAYISYDKHNSLNQKTGKQGQRKNFGSANGKTDFYGPVILRYLPQGLSDFRVKFRWSFHVNHFFAKGKEEFFLLDTNGQRRGVIRFTDDSNSGNVTAQIRLGVQSGKEKQLVSTSGKSHRSKTVDKVNPHVKYYQGATRTVNKPKIVTYSKAKIAAYKKQIAKIRKTKKPTKAQKKKLSELLKLQKSGWKYKKEYKATVGTQKTKNITEKDTESTYSQVYAEITIQRVGLKYSWKIAVLDPNTHKQKSAKSGNYTDKGGSYSNWTLGQVAYFAAKKNVSPWDDWNSKTKDTALHYAEDYLCLYDVSVDKITEVVDPSPVVKPNDELVFNCEDHTVYKNAARYMDKLAIGSKFTRMVAGEPTTIGFTPSLREADWAIFYKPRWK